MEEKGEGIMKMQRSNGRASSIPAGLAVAGAVSLGTTFVGSAVTAWLILRGSFPTRWAGYCAMVILLLSAAAGAVVAVSRIQRRSAQMCLASGGIYYGSLLAITALFLGGQFQGMVVTALMVFCGSGVVLLLGGGRKTGNHHRRRKIRKSYFGNSA